MKERLTRKLCMMKYAAQTRLIPNRGEGYVDTLIKILIAVVVGGILLTLLVALLNAIFPDLQARIVDMFNVGGGASSTPPTP